MTGHSFLIFFNSELLLSMAFHLINGIFIMVPVPQGESNLLLPTKCHTRLDFYGRNYQRLHPQQKAVEGVGGLQLQVEEIVNLLKATALSFFFFEKPRDTEGWRNRLKETSQVLVHSSEACSS